MAGVQPE